ncbi:MAG TPA: hypothetical protein VMZ53_02945 [Kofleriaceae bacterium]|nr:hypothetical protein [Kofleriaceae bacterium]
MRLHLVMDKTTGETRVRGSDGAVHTTAEIDAARRRAERGDEAARAFLKTVELPKGTTAAQLIHDCPECRAAMERGEKPTFLDPPQVERANRHGLFRRRPRWRDLKRTAGR